MSINKRREAKKKQRESDVKVKLDKRREAVKTASKEQLLEFREQRRFKKEHKEYQRLEKQMDELYAKLPQSTRDQLERNIEILKALEEEHKKETQEKQELNQQLESEGHFAPEDKMQALHERAVKECATVDVVKAKAQIGIQGGADYSFKPNS